MVFDLLGKRRFQSTAYKVAKEFRFYDITLGGETISLEPWLCSIESQAAQALEHLRASASISGLDAVERVEIAKFVATLAERGPRAREEIHELPGQVLEHMERFGPVAPNLREMLSAKDRDATVAVHNAVTVDISKLAPALAEMSWRLFAPPAGREFCTSDSPVLRFNPIDMGPRGNLGILCRGIQVQVALSQISRS